VILEPDLPEKDGNGAPSMLSISTAKGMFGGAYCLNKDYVVMPGWDESAVAVATAVLATAKPNHPASSRIIANSPLFIAAVVQKLGVSAAMWKDNIERLKGINITTPDRSEWGALTATEFKSAGALIDVLRSWEVDYIDSETPLCVHQYE
jgi:hypothetical protein